MSYDIYIGEAVMRAPYDDEDDSVEATVNVTTAPDAPSFPGDFLTKNENHRHPGYGQWADFTHEVGLFDLFFSKHDGLMRNHPGTKRLTPKHHDVIATALGRWKEAHPMAIPGWCPDCDILREHNPAAAAHVVRDGNLARLIWLDFWVGWALKTCKLPAMRNS